MTEGAHTVCLQLCDNRDKEEIKGNLRSLVSNKRQTLYAYCIWGRLTYVPFSSMFSLTSLVSVYTNWNHEVRLRNFSLTLVFVVSKLTFIVKNSTNKKGSETWNTCRHVNSHSCSHTHSHTKPCRQRRSEDRPRLVSGSTVSHIPPESRHLLHNK